MRRERQHSGWYQRLLCGADEESPRHDQGGADGIQSTRREASQALTASDQTRALTDDLMERICDRDNLNRAYRKVKANKGAPGGDGMASLTKFLETKLRLRVNPAKSAVAYISERKFLGHRLLSGGNLGIAPQSLDRAKQKVRALTRRNRGVSMERMVSELNSFLTGWVTYFRHARCHSHLQRLDEWIRHRVRCVQLKQRKRAKPISDFLRACGVPARTAWCLALSGKGWWRKAGSPPATHAMSLAWFDRLGLVSLTSRYAELQTS